MRAHRLSLLAIAFGLLGCGSETPARYEGTLELTGSVVFVDSGLSTDSSKRTTPAVITKTDGDFVIEATESCGGLRFGPESRNAAAVAMDSRCSFYPTYVPTEGKIDVFVDGVYVFAKLVERKGNEESHLTIRGDFKLVKE